MRCLRTFVMCAIATGLILITGVGRTDVIPLNYNAPPSGGGAFPKSPHETIRMDAEEAIIRLKPGSYTVDAVFWLSNSGETLTEWVGFPKNVMGRPPGLEGRVLDFIRFTVSVDGRIISFSEERDLVKSLQAGVNRCLSSKEKHSRWMPGQVTFPGHAVTNLRVSYESYYGPGGRGSKKAIYIYGTGRNWKGSIGKATFIIDATECGADRHAQFEFSSADSQKYLIRRRLISPNVVRYEVTDFEPSPDGTLSVLLSTARENKDLNYALHHAAMNGRLEVVQDLVEKGADVNAVGALEETPLMAAAGHGSLPVVELLVEKGADVNAKTQRGDALQKAMENGSFDMGQLSCAKFLKDRGAKPTTLAVAAYVGDMDAAQRLIAEGASLDEKSEPYAQNLLMTAAMGGQTDGVRFFLEKSIDVEAKNKQGQTALIVAAAGGHADVLRLLLDRGADIKAKDEHQRNALDHTVYLRGHVEAAKVLLERGADLNAPENRTILVRAAYHGHLAIVKLLLEKGADVNARDRNGQTALGLARGKDIEEIEKVLKAHGAKK